MDRYRWGDLHSGKNKCKYLIWKSKKITSFSFPSSIWSSTVTFRSRTANENTKENQTGVLPWCNREMVAFYNKILA